MREVFDLLGPPKNLGNKKGRNYVYMKKALSQETQNPMREAKNLKSYVKYIKTSYIGEEDKLELIKEIH